MAHLDACQATRSATANAFSFSSGESGGQNRPARPLGQALSRSARRLPPAAHQLRSATQQLDQEAYILTPSGLTPVIYEQGIDLDVVE